MDKDKDYEIETRAMNEAYEACCEICNSKVRFWCKVIRKIEDWPIEIINKLLSD